MDESRRRHQQTGGGLKSRCLRSGSHRVRRLLRRRLGPPPPAVGQQQQDEQTERRQQNSQRVSEDGLRREAAVRRASVSASFPVEKEILLHQRMRAALTVPSSAHRWRSQREEELLVDPGDAGDHAERQDAASQPHVCRFQQLPQ